MNQTTPPNDALSEAAAVVNRYKIAYKESKTTIDLGNILKYIGITLSILIGIISLFLSTVSYVLVINGLLGAVIVFAQFYILGTIISNGGHVHKINIDTAINTSPFLDNELKFQALQVATAHPEREGEQIKPDFSYPQVVAEISEIRPDMALCLKEASQYKEVNSARFEDLQKSYQIKSDTWLITKLTKVTGTFRSAYGLMVMEAYRRGINLTELTTNMPPDELPEL